MQHIDIDYIPHNIAIYKKDGDDFIIMAFNQAAEQTENTDRQNLIGKKFTETFSKQTQSELYAVLERVISSGKSETFDLNFYAEDIQKTWRIHEIVAIDHEHVMALYQDISMDTQREHNLISLGEMIDNSDNEYYIFSADDLRFTYFNQSAENNIGYTLEEISEMTPVDIKPDFNFEQFINLLNKLKQADTKQIVFETHHKRKDGSYYDVEARVQLMQVADKAHYVATVLDITNRKSLEGQLDSLGLIVDNSMNEVYIFDRKNLKFTYANKSAQKNIGYNLEALSKRTPVDIKPDYSYEDFIEQLKPLLSGDEEMITFETRHKRQDGSHYDVEARIQQHSINGKSHFVAIVVDISERKQNEMKLIQQAKLLEHLAGHDHLTNLPNRSLFMDRLSMTIKRLDRNKGMCALLFIDLDNFKPINDSYGHAFGDKVLVSCAHKLTQITRSSDTVARLGGDEFVVLMDNLNDLSDTEKLATKLLEQFGQPIEIDATSLDVHISIGIASYPKDALRPEELLSVADQALYKAKNDGKNNYQYFEQVKV